MSCICVKTAVIVENENELLRLEIKQLKQKLQRCQEELLIIYSSCAGMDYTTKPTGCIIKPKYCGRRSSCI